MSTQPDSSPHPQIIAGLCYGLFAIGMFQATRMFYRHQDTIALMEFLPAALFAIVALMSFRNAIAIHRGRKVGTLDRYAPALVLVSGFVASFVAHAW